MLRWFMEKGFTLEQIRTYANNSSSNLKDLINDSNIQIDDIIKRQLLLELYDIEKH